MIVDAVVISVMVLVGIPFVDHPDIDPWYRAAAAPLVGAAVFVLVGTASLAAFGIVSPWAVLGVSAMGSAAVASRRRDRGVAPRRWMLWSVVWVLAAVLLANWLPLTRLTADSIRYLINADLFGESGGLAVMVEADLLKRLSATSLLHTLSGGAAGSYSAGVGPVVGAGGWILLARLVWKAIDASVPTRLSVVALVMTFVATANRPLYGLFYINSHGLMASALLAAVLAVWHIGAGRSGWWPVLAICAGVLPLARPEGGITAALVFLAAAIAGNRRDLRPLLLASLVPAVASIAWFGVVVATHHGSYTATEAPFMLVAGCGSALLMVMLWVLPAMHLRLRTIAVAGMVLAIVAGLATGLDVLGPSAAATFQNLVLGKGAWGATWPAVLLLLGLTGMSLRRAAGGVGGQAAWFWFLGGFTVMYWLLPVLRNGPYRVGSGDSGNRILAHGFLVAIAAVVVGLTGKAVDRRAPATVLPR